MFIFDFIIGLIRNAAIFLGLIAALGLILQKRTFSEVLRGSLKAIIGMIILQQGVNVVINSISPLAGAFTELFSIQGSGSVGSFGDFIGVYGTEIGIIMLIAFVANIVIARFTPFKAIYLTGNMLFWYPMLFIAVGVEAGLTGTTLIVFASVIDIICIVVSPNLMVKPTERVTGTRDFTIAHTAMPFCILGDFIGGFIGDKTKSTEDMKVPTQLEFFRDTTVTSGIVMWLVYMLVGVLIPASVRAELYSGNMVVFSLVQGMMFAAGLVVILQGARMMLGEIVPAFNGIATKLVPGAIPGLDIPMVFPYAPTALLIGFVLAMGASIATIFVLGSLGMLTVAVVPLTIACYFDVAPGAIFANARGGRTAAIITSLVGGVLLMVVVSVTIPMLAHTCGDFLQAYGGNEFSLWTAFADLVAKVIPF